MSGDFEKSRKTPGGFLDLILKPTKMTVIEVGSTRNAHVSAKTAQSLKFVSFIIKKHLNHI